MESFLQSRSRARGPHQAGGEPGFSDSEGGDLKQLLAGLDSATRDFTRMLDLASERTDRIRSGIRDEARPAARFGEPRVEQVRSKARVPHEPPPDLLERRIAEAERQARLYLEEAKARADHLVRSILTSVEAEAERLISDAEAHADDLLRDADHQAEVLVEERRRLIGALSDEVVSRGQELAAQIEDGERVREQFLRLAAGLSEAANAIAVDHFSRT